MPSTFSPILQKPSMLINSVQDPVRTGTYIFGPPGSGFRIIYTDPAPDLDPFINKQKNDFWLVIFEDWCKCNYRKNYLSKKNIKIKIFSWHLASPWLKEQDLDPEVNRKSSVRIQGYRTDPYQKVSIRNTVYQTTHLSKSSQATHLSKSLQ
jgi:hypothetical protein